VFVSDEIASLQDAFKAATDETPLGEDVVGVTPSQDPPQEDPPAADEQVPVAQDQADDQDADPDSDDDLQSLLDGLAEADVDNDDDEGSSDPIADFVKSDDFWDTQVSIDTVNGQEAVSIKDLSDGYLRQADHTRKTQELAADRKQGEDATVFYSAFLKDPQRFAYDLAVKAQIVEQGAEPVGEIEVADFKTPAELESEIERRVEERFQADPRTVDLQVAAAQRAANEAFAAIEESRGVTIPPTLRERIVHEAATRGVGDLELVFEAMLSRNGGGQSKAAQRRKAAPARPSRPTAEDLQPDAPGIPDTVEEAFKMASAELSQQ
jgi:hypothetical protein